MEENKDDIIHTDETLLLPLEIESQGIVYEDKYKKIEKISAKFEEFNKVFFVSDFGEKAAVLVIRNNCILMARQYRLLINNLSYEIPGGKVNSNECPEEAAARECLEETGIYCKNLKPLITYDPDLEYTRNHTYVFYTDDVDHELPPSIDSSHVWLRFDKCLEMIYQGDISDSLSILTILAYQVKKDHSGLA
jgi:8-oxo-dGTP pyrophosphatase MutT (NUDIX family)